MPRMRTVPAALPTEVGVDDGLAYSLWLPRKARASRGGIAIVHGAGSVKESHHDYARAALAAGFAAIAFDQRGHGASEGPMDGRAIEDVGAIAAKLRSAIGDPAAPIALRGSSMGGYLALVAATVADARAVVAICPASADGLRRGLRGGKYQFEVDIPALDRLLVAHDERAAVERLEVPLLLLHAEGDEQVPVAHSRALAARTKAPSSRLITLPSGHHRSVQHDVELQAVSLRFIADALADGVPRT